MYRASTPTHLFTIPDAVPIDSLKDAMVTYAQLNEIVVEKRLEDMHIDGQVLSIELTQEETIKFRSNVECMIQLRVLTNEGKCMPSEIFKVQVLNVLNDEVMV